MLTSPLPHHSICLEFRGTYAKMELSTVISKALITVLAISFFSSSGSCFFREATGDFRGPISDFLTSFSDYEETIKVGMITNFSLPIQTSLFVF